MLEKLEFDIEIGGSYHEERHHFSFPLRKLNFITEADDNLSGNFRNFLKNRIEDEYSHLNIFAGEKVRARKSESLPDECLDWLCHPKSGTNHGTNHTGININLWVEDLASFENADNFNYEYVNALVVHLFYCAHKKICYISPPLIHPKRVHILADLCARLVNNGVQVFVYTNCDLLFSSFRVLMKRGVLNHEDCVCFLSKITPVDENGKNVITEQIDFGPGGKPNSWPRGFFDSLEEKMNELLEWNGGVVTFDDDGHPDAQFTVIDGKVVKHNFKE